MWDFASGDASFGLYMAKASEKDLRIPGVRATYTDGIANT